MRGMTGLGRKSSSRRSPRRRISSIAALCAQPKSTHCSSTPICSSTRATTKGSRIRFIQAWMRRVPVVSLRVDPDRLLSRGGLGAVPSPASRTRSSRVAALLDDPDRCAAIGARARSYALDHHAESNNATLARARCLGGVQPRSNNSSTRSLTSSRASSSSSSSFSRTASLAASPAASRKRAAATARASASTGVSSASAACA